MFGKSKRKATAKQYPGIGNLAAFVLTPSKSPKASTIFAEETLSETFATNTTCESISADNLDPSATTPLHKRTVKTGDSSSFWLSSSDNVYIDRACAMKGYRVVSYRKLKKTGKRIVFDILDGKPYYCGVGIQRKITDNAIVFSSRQEALSERFPSNQFEATKSGNGRHPRVLLAFDAWGHCKTRHGGIPSLVCEFVRFTKVEEYLDPPCPRVSRLVKRNVIPHNFPGPDTTPPNREVTSREMKIFRMFNVKKRVAAAVAEAVKQKAGVL